MLVVSWIFSKKAKAKKDENSEETKMLREEYWKINSQVQSIKEQIALERGNIYLDDRGYFYEKYNKKFLSKYKISFVQENISKSAKGTIRGLHWQSQPKAQDKLVTCITGKIFDVAVDLRRESDTFGFYCSRTLECDKNDSLWIPHGFAHGFQALTEDCVISYSVTSEYSKNETTDLLDPAILSYLTPYDPFSCRHNQIARLTPTYI